MKPVSVGDKIGQRMGVMMAADRFAGVSVASVSTVLYRGQAQSFRAETGIDTAGFKAAGSLQSGNSAFSASQPSTSAGIATGSLASALMTAKVSFEVICSVSAAK